MGPRMVGKGFGGKDSSHVEGTRAAWGNTEGTPQASLVLHTPQMGGAEVASRRGLRVATFGAWIALLVYELAR
jgi:hypothetical protein